MRRLPNPHAGRGIVIVAATRTPVEETMGAQADACLGALQVSLMRCGQGGQFLLVRGVGSEIDICRNPF